MPLRVRLPINLRASLRQETHVFLYGFGPVLLDGTIKTIELSVLSLATAVVLGLIGAAAKLSFNRPLRAIATGYTTLIR